MSAENVAAIERLYQEFSAGEAERAFAAYDPDIEWDATRAPWLLELGFDPVYHGHDGVRAAMSGYFEAWDSIEFEAHEIVDAGDQVLAFVRATARGRSSGVEVTYEHPQLWTFRDGLIVRMRVYADRG